MDEDEFDDDELEEDDEEFEQDEDFEDDDVIDSYEDYDDEEDDSPEDEEGEESEENEGEENSDENSEEGGESEDGNKEKPEGGEENKPEGGENAEGGEQKSDGENSSADDEDESKIGDDKKKDQNSDQEDILKDDPESDDGDKEDGDKEDGDKKEEDKKEEDKKDKSDDKDKQKPGDPANSDEKKGGSGKNKKLEALDAKTKLGKVLSIDDTLTLEQASKNKFNLPKVFQIMGRSLKNLFDNIIKWMQMGGWKVILVGMLAFLGLLAVGMIVYAIYSLLGMVDDANGGSGSGAKSAFGVTGDDFYGVRTVYKDNELANTELIEQYADFVAENVTQITEISTFSEYKFEVTLNIELPEQDFDYSKISTSTPIYNYVKEIADIVYKIDNNKEAPEDLTETLSGIKYFGFDEEIIAEITKEETDFMKLLTGYEVKQITYKDTTKTDEIPDEAIEDIKEYITGEIATLFEEKTFVRTEKLFVKDFILNGADAMLEGVQDHEYVTAIFMPKKDVTFTSFKISVSGCEEEAITSGVSVFEGANESKTLAKDEANFKIDDNSPNAFLYCGETTISATEFEDVDKQNLSALGEENVSLADIVANTDLDYLVYLTETETVGIFTIKTNGVRLVFGVEGTFKFAEMETLWN